MRSWEKKMRGGLRGREVRRGVNKREVRRGERRMGGKRRRDLGQGESSGEERHTDGF